MAVIAFLVFLPVAQADTNAIWRPVVESVIGLVFLAGTFGGLGLLDWGLLSPRKAR